MFARSAFLFVAMSGWFVSSQAEAFGQTYTMAGNTASRKIYNRTYNPMKFVTQGPFKITIVATRYTYKNNVLTVHDGQIWVNGPVSAIFYGASGSIGPRGGKISSAQTAYTRGMVNQITVSTTNLGPTLNINAWNMSINQYVTQ